MSFPLKQMVARMARTEDINDVHAFHVSQLNPFLWPRTVDELTTLASDGELFIVETLTDGIISMCYVQKDGENDKQRWEFGGIVVSEKYRGCGIATNIGMIAISNHFVQDGPSKHEQLIAHVHEDNYFPRNLLEQRLGFIMSGQERPPTQEIPKEIRRNAQGEVVADVFVFNRTNLVKYANWLESDDHYVRMGKINYTFLINVRSFEDNRDEVIQTLKQIATQ